MKKLLLVCILVSFLTGISGCSLGAATAGYAMRAGTADDLKYETRQSIINEAVAKFKSAR